MSISLSSKKLVLRQPPLEAKIIVTKCECGRTMRVRDDVNSYTCECGRIYDVQV